MPQISEKFGCIKNKYEMGRFLSIMIFPLIGEEEVVLYALPQSTEGMIYYLLI